MTVMMKPVPRARDTSLRRFLSTKMFEEYSAVEASNSEVTSSMMAITASQRLMSELDSGKSTSNLLLSDTRLELFDRPERFYPLGW